VTWSNFFLFVASILHYFSAGGGSNLRYFALHTLQDFMTPSRVLIQLYGLALKQRQGILRVNHTTTFYLFQWIISENVGYSKVTQK